MISYVKIKIEKEENPGGGLGRLNEFSTDGGWTIERDGDTVTLARRDAAGNLSVYADLPFSRVVFAWRDTATAPKTLAKR